MDSKGFGENAQEGPAPREALGRYTRSFEVEQNGLVTSWAIGKSTTAERAFYECQRVFVEVYNQTLSYQTVDPEKGSLFGER
jgi:hypothetical protein